MATNVEVVGPVVVGTVNGLGVVGVVLDVATQGDEQVAGHSQRVDEVRHVLGFFWLLDGHWVVPSLIEAKAVERRCSTLGSLVSSARGPQKGDEPSIWLPTTSFKMLEDQRIACSTTVKRDSKVIGFTPWNPPQKGRSSVSGRGIGVKGVPSSS